MIYLVSFVVHLVWCVGFTILEFVFSGTAMSARTEEADSKSSRRSLGAVAVARDSPTAGGLFQGSR